MIFGSSSGQPETLRLLGLQAESRVERGRLESCVEQPGVPETKHATVFHGKLAMFYCWMMGTPNHYHGKMGG